MIEKRKYITAELPLIETEPEAIISGAMDDEIRIFQFREQHHIITLGKGLLSKIQIAIPPSTLTTSPVM